MESPDGELSILVVDDVQIAQLNKEYLGREGPTNVMAFPQEGRGVKGEGQISGPGEDMPPELFGDTSIRVSPGASGTFVGRGRAWEGAQAGDEDMPPQLFGDVVISAETAAREAELGGIAMEERFLQLLVHGILHLFGYDHENDEDEAARMEAKSEAILGSGFGFANRSTELTPKPNRA